MGVNNKSLELNKIQKEQRLGVIKENNQGCLMQCIEYENTRHIRIKFLDDYGYEKNDRWGNFINGNLNNPYYPSLYGVACLGAKYYKREKSKENVKVYQCWSNMLVRCFDKKYKEKEPTYKNVTCCEEWLCYENFVDWIIMQENYNTWLNNKQWALDKDIIIKGNKIYSPETCCLVPKKINNLFTKNDSLRNAELPIGVYFNVESERYVAQVNTKRNEKNYRRNCGYYPTPEDAFYLGYKPYKEAYIQKVAKEEFDKGNITKRCYEAMMNYKVEITD